MFDRAQRQLILRVLFWIGVVSSAIQFSLSFVYMGEPLRYLGYPISAVLHLIDYTPNDSIGAVLHGAIPIISFLGLAAGFFLGVRTAVASGLMMALLAATFYLYVLGGSCVLTTACV